MTHNLIVAQAFCRCMGLHKKRGDIFLKMKRHPNGAGTVTKMSGNRSKPYMARVTVNGVRVSLGYYKTAQEGYKAIANYSPLGADAIVKEYTLSELYESWTERPDYAGLSKSTQDNYTAAYRYMDKWRKVRFADLRLPDFQRMIKSAQDKGRSRSTLEKIRCLQVLLGKYAFALDIVDKVYAESVTLPKPTPTKPQVFTRDEVERVLTAADNGTAWADVVAIMLYTGFRVGELLTVKKADVDLTAGIIKGGLKTEAGRDRIVPIHPRIAEYVRRRVESAKSYLIEKDGLPIRQQYFRRSCYYPLLDQLQIDRAKTPHKTRHTFVSMLDAATTDKRAMAEITGHTDPNFTEKVYSHPDAERLKKVMSEI